jgi:hypothetical protein
LKLLILKIIPVTRFKDHKAAILTLKVLIQEATFDSVKSYRKPHGTVNSCSFSLQPMRLTQENIDKSQQGNSEEPSVSIFKISEQFQRSK